VCLLSLFSVSVREQTFLKGQLLGICQCSLMTNERECFITYVPSLWGVLMLWMWTNTIRPTLESCDLQQLLVTYTNNLWRRMMTTKQGHTDLAFENRQSTHGICSIKTMRNLLGSTGGQTFFVWITLHVQLWTKTYSVIIRSCAWSSW
jgi:hypothetical protein